MTGVGRYISDHTGITTQSSTKIKANKKIIHIELKYQLILGMRLVGILLCLKSSKNSFNMT